MPGATKGLQPGTVTPGSGAAGPPGRSADQARPHPLCGTAGETRAGLALNGCTVQFHYVVRHFFVTETPKLFNQKEYQLQASLSAFPSSLQGRGIHGTTY